MTLRKIRIRIVDDSPLDRELLLAILEEPPDFEVVGQAADAFETRDKVRSLDPDVLTLDVSMPGMGGLQFLRNLVRLRPTPVVMVSAETEEGIDVTLEALSIGAVDFIAKPGAGCTSLAGYRDALVGKVRTAAHVQLRRPPQGRPHDGVTTDAGAGASTSTGTGARMGAGPRNKHPVDVIAVGASTGGVTAIERMLISIPAGALPPIVITQHIPAGFSRRFAERLHAQQRHAVHEAVAGMALERGHVYVAPGGRQFAIQRTGERHRCVVELGERVNLRRPSVDVLFHSVAQHAGPREIGVLPTGMGQDGAQGLRAMRDRGAFNIVQDAATSLVWGCPARPPRSAPRTPSCRCTPSGRCSASSPARRRQQRRGTERRRRVQQRFRPLAVDCALADADASGRCCRHAPFGCICCAHLYRICIRFRLCFRLHVRLRAWACCRPAATHRFATAVHQHPPLARGRAPT